MDMPSTLTGVPADGDSPILDEPMGDLTGVEAPPCPQCEAPSAAQVPVWANRDGAYFRADFICQRCDHDHPVWYEE